ncbi:MAG: biotin transporter BioY [Thermosipho sp. (in: Bacteria)]|nr:biotin transporter BioY [Thermosipho sp. (in: thermotogales)]
MKTKDLALISLFVSLTIVGAQVSIPIGNVPFTLQILIVFLTGYVLRPWMAFLTQIIYLLMGAIGLPVFANFSGGLFHLLGPTGGYLLAFPFAALIVSFSRQNLYSKFIYGISGLAIVYFLGTSVLAFYTKSFVKAILVGVLPFIALDFIKLTVAIFVSEKLEILEVK